MKNPNILIAALIITFTGMGNSQNVFPLYEDDPIWNSSICFWGINCHTETYSYESEVIMCGKTYAKIEINNIDFTDAVYVRSDSIKAYFRLSIDCAEKEYLMYDYSLNIGDTVFVGEPLQLNPGIDTNAFILENIETVNYFGVDRKRFTMSFDPDPGNPGGPFLQQMYWIEGIGSESDPFYPFRCFSGGCEGSFNLLCYDSSGIQLYQNPAFSSCFVTTGISDLQPESEIKIYPNPFQSKITIEMDADRIQEIELYTLQGQRFMNYKIVKDKWLTIIFEEDIRKGIYLLKAQTEIGTIAQLIMK